MVQVVAVGTMAADMPRRHPRRMQLPTNRRDRAALSGNIVAVHDHGPASRGGVCPVRERREGESRMTTTPPQPDYLVRLHPLPRSGPVASRLRRFLKSAIRAYGLRAVSIREIAAEEPLPVIERQQKDVNDTNNHLED
jgi:hypothetical protein